MRFSYNGPGDLSFPIGIATLLSPLDVRDASFQTASWWEDVHMEPQQALIWSNGYYVSYGFKGVTTAGYFPSSFGGLSYGDSNSQESYAGRERSYGFQHYGYAFAKSFGEGTLRDDVDYVLFDGYGVDSAPYDHDPSKTGWFITVPETHRVRVQRAGGSGFDKTHTYNVWIDGEPTPEPITVEAYRGFNGDTRQVAMRDAAAKYLLPLVTA